MGQPFIVLGDATNHGGKVILGSPYSDVDGKPIARVGDKVTCPQKGHGGVTTIVSGDPNCLIDGQPAARHGDKTACGATLIASQSLATSGGAGLGSGAGGSWAAAHAAASSSGLAAAAFNTFDDKFQWVDHDSQQPIANHLYAIEREDGQMEHGVTDGNGFTHLLSSVATAENVKIYLEG